MTWGRWALRMRGCVAEAVALCALLGAGAARADVPGTMNFQGLLLDAAGNPKNGNVTLVFRLYNVATGGSPLWSETLASVPVSDGIYDVALGATIPLTPALFADPARYLEVTVNGEVLAPRRQLLVVPYALRAESADTAATAATAATATSVALTGNFDAAGHELDDVGAINGTGGFWTLNDSAEGDFTASNRAALRIRSAAPGGAAEFVSGYGAGAGEFMVKFVGYDADTNPGVEQLFGYINKAGHILFRSSLTVSGKMNDGSLCEAELPSGSLNDCRILQADYGSAGVPSDNYMLGVWSDVHGPAILARSNNADPPSMPFMGMHSDGTPTFQVMNTGEVQIWDGDSHFGTLDMADLSLSRTYDFPDKDGEVLLRNGAWGTPNAVPMTADASGSDVIDSGIRVDGVSAGTNYVALPRNDQNASELRFYEDASHPGGNYLSLRAVAATRDLVGDASIALAKLARATGAAAGRGPVIGAVAVASTLDTPEQLCDQQYASAQTGVDASCLPGSAKEYAAGGASVAWVGSDYPNDNCSATVPPGRYFEVVCSVED